MSFLVYKKLIPDAPNNPSNDQPDMKINNDSASDIWDVDHFGFNNNFGGFHAKTTYVNRTTVPTPAAGQIALFSIAGSASSELNSIKDANAGTQTVLITSKIGAPSAEINGSTYLPGPKIGVGTFNGGGILLFWGTVNVLASGTGTPVSFNPAFPNQCFNVVLTMINNQGNSPSANSLFVKSGSVTPSGFTIINTSSSSAQQAYWQAIGN